MSGLKSRISEKSLALVQRETITLPRCGEIVTVRGLMTGELQRVNAAQEAEQATVIVCLCAEDPQQPGTPLFNVNTLEDRTIAGQLHIEDATAIIDAHNRLSGLKSSDSALLGNLARTENSSSSSPSDTESFQTG